MDAWRPPTPSQLRRLVEELAEAGLDLDGSAAWPELAIEEIAYAMRPKVHERYVPSYGAIVQPTTDPETWRAVTGLVIERGPISLHPDARLRSYADGIASWLMRHADGTKVKVTLGSADDWPVTGDWNGDRVTDIGVYDPGTATFTLRTVGADGLPVLTPVVFGLGTDLPVTGDLDGNGITDVGIWRPSTGTLAFFTLVMRSISG